MSSYYKVTAISSEKKYLEKIGIKENVATFHLEMTRKITPIKDIIAVVKLYIYLKKVRPEIVHTHTPKAGIVGMLASKLAGVPNRLHTIAGLPLLEHSGLKRKILNFVEKLTYDCATKVYPNSFELQKIIINNKLCNPSKSIVIANGSSNGINTSFFNPKLFSSNQNNELRNKLNIQKEDLVFIFVGRLVADKGINELISAFLKLLKENTKIKLLLVGNFETNLDPLLPSTLNSINNNKSIISVGYQNDVRPFFAISNTLVFPSYREGFPNVVMQAGAMGLSSIVSNINGCNEIIINQENGIIIPVKNQNALFEAMKLLITDTDLELKIKNNSRQMIVNRYEQNIVWNAILEEYRKFDKP
jgi:glycosyltransferase involved in cell wall biosynthesis